MTKQETPGTREPSIPSEADWGDYRADLDLNWAYDHHCGRSHKDEAIHPKKPESIPGLQPAVPQVRVARALTPDIS